MQLPDLPQTEQVVIEMTNIFRVEQKLSTLKPNPTLAKAARAFATYLADTGRFGHTVDGRQPADRTKEAGYRHCIVAENLAVNQDSRGFATRALADQAVTGWKNSPPHRAAMLNPNVTEVGIGIVKAADAAPKYISVQLFGRPDSFKYTFKIENRADVAIQYAFKGKPVDVPTLTAITQTACTPETLAFRSIGGSFTASDGTLYRVTRSANGKLQVEVVNDAVKVDGARPEKNP